MEIYRYAAAQRQITFRVRTAMRSDTVCVIAQLLRFGTKLAFRLNGYEFLDGRRRYYIHTSRDNNAKTPTDGDGPLRRLCWRRRSRLLFRRPDNIVTATTNARPLRARPSAVMVLTRERKKKKQTDFHRRRGARWVRAMIW